MLIGVVGLGLIGGSMAKAIKKNTDHRVYGTDLIESVRLKAKLLDAIDEELSDETLQQCDIVLLAMYPGDTLNYAEAHAGLFKKGAIVIDLCGVKQVVCEPLHQLALANGFTYIGGHPMAGREFSGFAYSSGNLFEGASMILVPFQGTPIEIVQSVKQLFNQVGFSLIQISTAAEHDRMIAFTSQLAHIVSSAYIKSPTALDHIGFSAGSFKDMTRVAKLNETMWTELFLANREFLSQEIECLIENLNAYNAALKADDQQTLFALLKEGRERKAVVDGEEPPESIRCIDCELN